MPAPLRRITAGGITLGQFLRARRSQIRPADVGLPAGRRRRVAGLRREEVALLAGISTDYYQRLEQGRDDSPSDQVLDAIGRALQLDGDAMTYMRNLLHRRAVVDRMEQLQTPHPAMAALLDGWPLAAALVVGPGLTVVSANKLAEALCPHFGVEANIVRGLFLDPQMRSFFENWERVTAWAVSSIRAMLGHRSDPHLTRLVGELRTHSPRFRHLWARHGVTEAAAGVTSINHPQVGRLDLNYQQMLLPGTGHRLIAYWAEPGSASEMGLRRLANGQMGCSVASRCAS